MVPAGAIRTGVDDSSDDDNTTLVSDDDTTLKALSMDELTEDEDNLELDPAAAEARHRRKEELAERR